MAAAAMAALACAPAGAKEWSKDKAWTVTEFNQGACLMRTVRPSGAVLQVIEAVDRHGGFSVSGLPNIADKPMRLRYGFTDQNYMTVLAWRARTYLTEKHDSIDTLLWSVSGQPAKLLGKPALESEMPRNFVDLLGAFKTVMLTTEEGPGTEGFFDLTGSPAAISALRQCTAAQKAKLPKEAQ
jgi:hypothetical protein